MGIQLGMNANQKKMLGEDVPVTPIDNEIEMKSAQEKMRKLLNTLLAESTMDQRLTYDAKNRITELMSRFKSNLQGMETEFKSMLDRFRLGTLTSADIQDLLDSERERSLFILELASDVQEILEMLFSGINTTFSDIRDGRPVLKTAVDKIFSYLDLTMESVVSISRVSVAMPRSVQSAIRMVQETLRNLHENVELGHFARLRREMGDIGRADTSLYFIPEHVRAPSGKKHSVLRELQEDPFDDPDSRRPSFVPDIMQSIPGGVPPLVRSGTIAKSSPMKIFKTNGEVAIVNNALPPVSTQSSLQTFDMQSQPSKLMRQDSLFLDGIPFRFQDYPEQLEHRKAGLSTQRTCSFHVDAASTQGDDPFQLYRSGSFNRAAKMHRYALSDGKPPSPFPVMVAEGQAPLLAQRSVKWDELTEENDTGSSPGQGQSNQEISGGSAKLRKKATEKKRTKSKAAMNETTRSHGITPSTSGKEERPSSASRPTSPAQDTTRSKHAIIAVVTAAMLEEGQFEEEWTQLLAPDLLNKVKGKVHELEERHKALDQKEAALSNLDRLTRGRLSEMQEEVEVRARQQAEMIIEERLTRQREELAAELDRQSMQQSRHRRIILQTAGERISMSVMKGMIIDIIHAYLYSAEELKRRKRIVLSRSLSLQFVPSNTLTHVDMPLAIAPLHNELQSQTAEQTLLQTYRGSISSTKGLIVVGSRPTSGKEDTSPRKLSFGNIPQRRRVSIDSLPSTRGSPEEHFPSVRSTAVAETARRASIASSAMTGAQSHTHMKLQEDSDSEGSVESGFFSIHSHDIYATNPTSAIIPPLPGSRKQSESKSRKSSYFIETSVLDQSSLNLLSPLANQTHESHPTTRKVSLAGQDRKPSDLELKSTRHPSGRKASTASSIENEKGEVDSHLNGRSVRSSRKESIAALLEDYEDNQVLLNEGYDDEEIDDFEIPIAHRKLSSAFDFNVLPDLLKSSQKPLLLLFEAFRAYLPEISRMHFLSALHQDISNASVSSMARYFKHILQQSVYIQNRVELLEKRLHSHKKIVDDLMELTSLTKFHNKDFEFENSLRKSYRTLGDISVATTYMQVIHHELRRIYETMTKSELNRFPTLLESCEDFRSSYGIFVRCQGKLMSMRDIIDALIDKTDKIFCEMKIDRHKKETLKSTETTQEINSLTSRLQALQQKIEDLEKELTGSNLRAATAEHILRQSYSKNDCTPAALLFFSALIEDASVYSIEQTILQLEHFKNFLNGTEHMDFPTLRKKIQTCTVYAACLQKFINKYKMMKEKWERDRNKVINDRVDSGNPFDMSMICPLCSVDAQFVDSSLLRRKLRRETPSMIAGTSELQQMAATLSFKSPDKITLRSSNNLASIRGEPFANDITIAVDSIAVKLKGENEKSHELTAVDVAAAGDLKILPKTQNVHIVKRDMNSFSNLHNLNRMRPKTSAGERNRHLPSSPIKSIKK